MTVNVVVKTYNCIVLASDSALTSGDDNQVYNHGNKIFGLFPHIAVMIHGQTNIGLVSIDNYIKDFRLIPRNCYDVRIVTQDLLDYMQEKLSSTSEEHDSTGFIVSGFSPDCLFPVSYGFELVKNKEKLPILELATEYQTGTLVYAQKQAVDRILFGFDDKLAYHLQDGLVSKLKSEGIDDEVINIVKTYVKNALFDDDQFWQMVNPYMPIQDSINLARFLVDVSIKTSHFKHGTNTIGGDTDILVITKYEGIKWVQRKYYFDRQLNPDNQYEPPKGD